MIARLLNAFTQWALSRNAPGGYAGENDKRWAYTIETDGDPYLTRILLDRLVGLRNKLGIGVYLHKFHRPDIDEHLHNHPWKRAFSLVLSGSYDEARLIRGDARSCRVMYDGTPVEHRRVRFFNYLTKDDYHQVRQLHGDVWTLFVTGPRIQDWGFLADGIHVPWRKYLKKEK